MLKTALFISKCFLYSCNLQHISCPTGPIKESFVLVIPSLYLINTFQSKKIECEQTYWKTKDGDGDSTRSEIVLSVGPTIGALYPGDTQD